MTPTCTSYLESIISNSVPLTPWMWFFGVMGQWVSFHPCPESTPRKMPWWIRGSLSKISRWVDSERPWSLDGLGFPAYGDGAAEDYRITLVKGLVMEVWMTSWQSRDIDQNERAKINDLNRWNEPPVFKSIKDQRPWVDIARDLHRLQTAAKRRGPLYLSKPDKFLYRKTFESNSTGNRLMGAMRDSWSWIIFTVLLRSLCIMRRATSSLLQCRRMTSELDDFGRYFNRLFTV